MFKIEAIVDDKRVGDALRALLGIARGMPHAIPIVNAEEHPAEPGKLKAKSNGSLLGMFEQWLIANKPEEPMRVGIIRVFLKAKGRPVGSAGYLAKQAVAAGLLKKSGTGSGTKYHVVKRLAHHG